MVYPAGGSEPPFRDEASAALLGMYGIEQYQDDWYSVKVDGRRTSYAGLDFNLKYALVMIYYSNLGKYIKIEDVSLDRETWDNDEIWDDYNKIWHVLEKQDIVLRVACTQKDA